MCHICSSCFRRVNSSKNNFCKRCNKKKLSGQINDDKICEKCGKNSELRKFPCNLHEACLECTDLYSCEICAKSCIKCGNNFYETNQSLNDYSVCETCSQTNIEKFRSNCKSGSKKCICCKKNSLINRFGCGKNHESLCFDCFPVNNSDECEICLNNLT